MNNWKNQQHNFHFWNEEWNVNNVNNNQDASI